MKRGKWLYLKNSHLVGKMEYSLSLYGQSSVSKDKIFSLSYTNLPTRRENMLLYLQIICCEISAYNSWTVL